MLTYFKTLGTQELHGDAFHKLEKFVCYLYGAKIKNRSNTQRKEFDQNLHAEHKVTDLASLSPCKQVLLYHANRMNLIAYKWEISVQPIIAMPEISSRGFKWRNILDE